MLSRLRELPYLFAAVRLNGLEPGTAVADLRLQALPGGELATEGRVLSVQVVRQLGWQPDQPIYFAALRGSLSLEQTGPESARIFGTVEGSYRPPVRGIRELTGDGDHCEAPAVPASLGVSLEISLADPQATTPDVAGSLVIHSDALVPEGKLESTVAGRARLFASYRKVNDPAITAPEYYLPILPLLVQNEDATVVFQSTDRLLRGAIDVWRACDIGIEPEKPTRFAVKAKIIKAIKKGNLDPLLTEIQTRVPYGGGVPVAFLYDLFATSGGMTFDNLAQRAVVMVTEQSPDNDTLLAHELGHVLGGKEAGTSGARETKDYWVGEDKTLMDGTGDARYEPPSTVGTIGCRNAPNFARSR